MKLDLLLEGIDVLRRSPAAGIAVEALAYDSRRVSPGSLFFAVPGFKLDGHRFLAQAAAGGAVVAVVEDWQENVTLPQIQVRDARLAMAQAAAIFYGHPSRRLRLTGVTGTNGKTTTTFLLESILRAAGRSTGLLGGVEYRLGSRVLAAPRTTPEAIDLEAMLAEMAEAGVRDAAIEVSSHGIDLYRVAELRFTAAVFTNLTQDHLDLHGGMERYYDTKLRLFTGRLEGRDRSGPDDWPAAAVNVDDEYGRRLLADLRLRGGRTLAFGLSESAAVTAQNVVPGAGATTFELVTPEGRADVELPLPGNHNLSNALGAAAAAVLVGAGTDAIATGLAQSSGPPGRFETVAAEPFQVIVDYAHNEDGLSKALKAARMLTTNKLIVVFGCPGERDREKRPLMGKRAGELADLAILTTDDCYGESPDRILDEAEAGLRRAGASYRRIGDRREAIAQALAEARPGDVVVIAGKGHETRQIMADGPHPFSDRDTVREVLGFEKR